MSKIISNWFRWNINPVNFCQTVRKITFPKKLNINLQIASGLVLSSVLLQITKRQLLRIQFTSSFLIIRNFWWDITKILDKHKFTMSYIKTLIIIILFVCSFVYCICITCYTTLIIISWILFDFKIQVFLQTNNEQ